jgi:hypothetical protein
MIFKISGCSQIWCVDCHTAFNFHTLEVERGNIHNPHYYEYLRTQNGGVIPRNPGDVQPQNQPIGIDRIMLTLGMQRGISGNVMNYISDFHRLITHIQMIEIDTRNNPINEPTNRQIRIKYLMGKLTEKGFKQKIQKTEENFEQQLQLNVMYQAFVETVNDILRSIVEENNMEYSMKVVLELRKLVNSFNETLEKYCKENKIRLCPYIDDRLLFTRKELKSFDK